MMPLYIPVHFYDHMIFCRKCYQKVSDDLIYGTWTCNRVTFELIDRPYTVFYLPLASKPFGEIRVLGLLFLKPSFSF